MASHKLTVHKETYYVIGKNGEYLSENGKLEKISPLDAERFYTAEHLGNIIIRYEGYGLNSYKCTLTVKL